ncbi:D-hexose-6-phosphate mutarotase [Neptunicella sp. SCSIO 80796]|uniref:D-hexose-6-phosphate mutarotase n=1 Tax=Neptunicella plasticusilytica TaxID=3117012 RepID=UPI003A4D72C0
MQLSPSVSLESSPSLVDCLEVNNAFAFAKISLFGGHIISFCPKSDQRERLWLSDKTRLDGSKAIRGGVPICWPWFGHHVDSQFPAHGYVREQLWHVTRCEDTGAGTEITLAPETCVGDGFDGLAALRLKIIVGQQLKIELITENIGNSSFSYNAALHSYFSVDDIQRTRLSGLSGKYIDKVAQRTIATTPETYIFSTETDRIHLVAAPQVTIEVPAYSIPIYSEGHDSVVVWNPWIEKSAGMSDMTKQGYLNLLCVETAITQDKILAAGEVHRLVQTIG